MKKNILNDVLARHGIEDARKFLLTKGEDAVVKSSREPEVRLRGSVQLMKQRKVSREAVKVGFDKLEYL